MGMKEFFSAVKDTKGMLEYNNRQDAAWYFTQEARLSHDKASLSERVTFYADYIRAINSNFTYNDKLGCILALIVDGSTLEYGVFPDILSPEKNPLIKYVKENKDYDVGKLLNAIHGSNEDWNAKDAHLKLTQISKGEKIPDIYKLERAIIWADYVGEEDDREAPLEVYNFVFRDEAIELGGSKKNEFPDDFDYEGFCCLFKDNLDRA